MKTTTSTVQRSVRIAFAGALLASGLSAKALILTTAPQVFLFGANDLDFTQSASLATFNQPGTLTGVHIELSGGANFTLKATSGTKAGTINSMTEDVAFSLTGLPFTALSTSIPTYSVGTFALPASSSMSFTSSGIAPLTSVDLSMIAQLNVYNVSAGAPLSIPFQFFADETFNFNKKGSGLAAGSEATGTGSARVWYSYELQTPPPPVPEVSTAISAGAFTLIGAVFLLRNRKTQAA
jgi:hypothetical protein